MSQTAADSLDTTTLQPDLEDGQDMEKQRTGSFQEENLPMEITEKEEDDSAFRVTLGPEDDPKHLPLLRKWIAVLVISSASLCVTCASSIAGFAEIGEARDFHVSREVMILGISVFVEGLGWGPMLLGPLSEFYGRNAVYWTSYTLYWIFSWPVAFAPNAAVFLVFRFICGFMGSAFLSVAGGSVSDLFSNDTVATPMAVYTFSPFIGPVLGPLISGFVNQHLDWRWTYRIQIIWTFVELVGLWTLIPETYEPLLVKRKAQRLRKSTGDSRYWAPLERSEKGIFRTIVVSCYTPFQLIFYDRMALLLNTWTALVLGILYLAFQAFPIIFGDVHGFNTQSVGLSFIGIGVGMTIGLLFQPVWNRIFAKASLKHNGNPPPELRLYMGMPGGILCSIALFWLAFTTYPGVPWIVPILASVPFGTGIFWVFVCVFTYLVTAYRPIAASAMASNSALRSAFAAAFPLFATQMYGRLGTVGATALLAGLSTIMAPLPFIFYKYGHRIRATSRFAVKDQ